MPKTFMGSHCNTSMLKWKKPNQAIRLGRDFLIAENTRQLVSRKLLQKLTIKVWRGGYGNIVEEIDLGNGDVRVEAFLEPSREDG